jgi:hypothetical protein
MLDNEFPEFYDPDLWCGLSDAERRARLGRGLERLLSGAPGFHAAHVRVGPVDRPYDLTAVAEADVGMLRTALWSHARAAVFCDPSIHPANRKQLAPGLALAEAAERLRDRLSASFALESRGLTITQALEPGVERVWTAERSRFTGRTSVTREDRVAAAKDVDLRDLLAHFYSGPSLRLQGADGSAFLLPAGAEPEDGRLISLCSGCSRWVDSPADECPECSRPMDTLLAMRPARR